MLFVPLKKKRKKQREGRFLLWVPTKWPHNLQGTDACPDFTASPLALTLLEERVIGLGSRAVHTLALRPGRLTWEQRSKASNIWTLRKGLS